MRITPLDARKQEFSKSMRGFDCDEVRAFLNTLADEYETVLVDNKQIRDRVLEQEDQITEYQKMERTLRDTLMTAERVMQDTRENAGREGDLIIQEAQMKAKGILEECRMRTEELRREIMGLRKEKETYLARFRSLAEAQIKFVDNHESDFEDLDRRLVDIVDSVVTSTSTKPESSAKSTAGPSPVPHVAPTRPEPMPAHSVEAGPAVAPSPTPAPVAGEHDIWRDYTPAVQGTQDSHVSHGSHSSRDDHGAQVAPAAAKAPAETVVATNQPDPFTAAQAATPAASPAASDHQEATRDVPEGASRTNGQGDDDVAGSIADLVSESLAETVAGQDPEFRPPVEPLNVDVITNPAEADQKDENEKVGSASSRFGF